MHAGVYTRVGDPSGGRMQRNPGIRGGFSDGDAKANADAA
jgi:hypothetical protein